MGITWKEEHKNAQRLRCAKTVDASVALRAELVWRVPVRHAQFAHCYLRHGARSGFRNARALAQAELNLTRTQVQRIMDKLLSWGILRRPQAFAAAIPAVETSRIIADESLTHMAVPTLPSFMKASVTFDEVL